MKRVISYFAYLLVVWGFYRLLFQLPEEVEELIVKPLVWLLPPFYIVLVKEKSGFKGLGIGSANLFKSVYFAFALGAIFAIEGMIVNFLKYGGLNFGANIGEKAIFASLGISFATAVSEELAFRGYIFSRLRNFLKNEILANLVSSAGWTVIHLPVAIFVWRLDAISMITYLLLTAIFGIGSAFIFARTKNVASSVLLHVFWQWPIILFR